MPENQRPFRILFRHFLFRLLDFEILSRGGDLEQLMIQFAALLGAFNLVVVILAAPRYGISTLSRSVLLVRAWSDEEFLIATTIAVVGMLMVLAWDALLPDLRDALVLGVLPLRTRSIALAKVSAIGCVIFLAALVVNFFSGFAYALIASPDAGVVAVVRSFCAYWLTMFSAAAFTACFLLTLQGVCAQIVGYRFFIRISSLLQFLAFFIILAAYFLKPPLASPEGLSASGSRAWLQFVPSYWFLGLFHVLNGTPSTIFQALALRAGKALLCFGTLAAVAFALAYWRTTRQIVEQPDISPATTGARFRIGKTIARILFETPLDRAVFLFIARGLTRSRKHRLLFALYAGIGLALGLAYTESLLHGEWRQNWAQPNAPLLVASLVVIFFAIFGMRLVFALPLALPANWAFRVTAVQSPRRYFLAVRKSLYVLAAFPLWIAWGVLLLAIWPGRPVLLHVLVMALACVVIVERSLAGFRKIPFTCSYLPGKANLKVTLALYGSAIFFLSFASGSLEFWSMQRAARFVVVSSLLALAAVLARFRFREFADTPFSALQFEESTQEMVCLDFRDETGASEEASYLDVSDVRSPGKRALRWLLILLGFVAGGIAYEQAGRLRDRKALQQVGTSVDIGGRALNIYCSGDGSPTVIFEANWGSPGYSWLQVQREVARFTRACWYDRAGYGWSDPGPFPNHSDSISRDLHRLLLQAHVSPPYVLAAHAIGSFHARVFRGFYPEEVAGLVLIDPTSEDLTIHIHNHIEFFRPAVLLLHRIMGDIGFMRLVKPDPGSPAWGFTQKEWNTLAILRFQTKSLVAEGKEPPLWICGEQARAAGSFGSIPVMVLSAGIQDHEEDPKLDQDQPLKLELQRNLANLSTRGVQIVVEKAGHDIPHEAPETVVEALQRVISRVRTE
jgi:pimeloyl-ACP methyl ester carboxylesterase